jgi:multiple sugar transport system substrate-binding protein
MTNNGERIVTTKGFGRRVVLGGLAANLLALRAQAEGTTVTLLAHPVIRSVAEGPQGGDITAAWRKRTDNVLEWVTLDTNPLHERLFREASLGHTSIDVATLLNARAVPRITSLFEPLDDYMKAEPIEDMADIFPGLLKAMTFGGNVYGIPFRHSTSGLHYNSDIFAERGIAGPPTSIEEFIDIARKTTFTHADGTQVYGFVISGATYANIIDLARAWNGDFIDADKKVVANQPPMVKAITVLRDFYKEGVLPHSFAEIKDEEVTTWMTGGRTAMTIQGLSRTQFYNDPTKSQFAGKFKTAVLPVAAALKSRFEAAPVKTEFWSFVIPKNSSHQKAAWGLVVDMLSKDSTLKAALNGNGPVRASTYRDPQILARLPYAPVEALELKYARVPLPAFDNSARAADIFIEEVQAAVIAGKDPQAAMDNVVRRVQPLVH